MREALLIAHDLRAALKKARGPNPINDTLKTYKLVKMADLLGLELVIYEAVSKLMEIGAVGNKKGKKE